MKSRIADDIIMPTDIGSLYSSISAKNRTLCEIQGFSLGFALFFFFLISKRDIIKKRKAQSSTQEVYKKATRKKKKTEQGNH
jgi:hypothetical protein